MARTFHHGDDDGLEPLRSLDLDHVENFSDLLKQMSDTAFGGRELGNAYHVLLKMIRDPDCRIVMTMSGAMTIAKMGKIVCDMIENELVHMLITTGAIMAHGLTESIGCLHYKYDTTIRDNQLYEWGYNRVYDTLEKEESLTEAEHIISKVLSDFQFDGTACSHKITGAVGKYLYKNQFMPSILGCAFHKSVPVYIPAFTDSEFGLNVSTHLMAQKKHRTTDSLDSMLSDVPQFNPYYDLYDYARNLCKAKRIGIITIGGGVPRNWGQQVGPFVDIINLRIGTELMAPRFQYGVRICPEPVHWGGLSGCTYSEGMSWGKFIPQDKGGAYSEVLCDATVALPILIKAVIETLKREGR